MRKSLWAAALLAAGCLVSVRSIYEPDLWWHLAQGRETAAGHLVRTNIFSIAYANYPQPYTSWLFDLGAWWLWTRIGPVAIQILQAVLIAATLGVTAAACRLRASIAATVAVALVGWVVLEPRALPRPHLFSFLGIATAMYFIERARAARSWRPLGWTPLVVAIWSNLHVECVFGVAAIGLFAAGEWIRPRDLPRRDAGLAILAALASLAATACNPYGIGLLRYTYENSLVPQVISIAELQPPYWPNYRGFFAWTALLAALVVFRRSRVTLGDAGIIVLFALLGFRFLRLTPLLVLGSAPLVARGLDDLRTIGVTGRRLAVTAVVATLLLMRVPPPSLIAGVRLGGDALEPRALFSRDAMAFARSRGLSGPVFASINLGGYVAWHLYPAARIFLDSRLQAYPPEHFRMVIAASADPAAWARMTAGVDWAVLSRPRVNDLSGVGQFDPAEWETVYRDEAIDIVVRRSPKRAVLREP